MRRFVSVLPVLFFLFASTRAHADTVFNVQGTLQDGVGQFNGTLTYLPQYQDVGRVTGTITDGAYTFTVPSYLGETLDEGGVTEVNVFSVGLNYDLDLNIPDTILAGGVGGALCSLSSPCSGAGPSYFQDYDLSGNGIFSRENFQTLTISPQVTPEPGSFVLLGTAITGVTAELKRRAHSRRRQVHLGEA